MAASRNRRSPDPVGTLRHVLRAGLEGIAAHAVAGRTPPPAALRCVVGFSGGRDSVVLLHVLAALRAETGISLSALHVHHGLSPNADAWAAFCREFCKLLDVPLQVERVAVDRASGEGLEGAARTARYAAFRRVDADLVVLAHHAGDQAETLLFNLLRGAGVDGASAMPPIRPLADDAVADGLTVPRLFRPLLAISPASLDAYCRHFGLAHIDDESNADTQFSRNFLRHRIVAPVEARFPGATSRLAGAARRFGEARQLLDELAVIDLQGASTAGCLRLSTLQALSPARQRNVLRRWLSDQAGDVRLGEEGLDELCRQMREARRDALVERRVGALVLRVWRGGLYVVPVGSDTDAAPMTQRWHGEPVLDWAGGRLHFDAASGAGIALRPGQVLEVRSRRGGERIRLPGGRPSQAVRTLFQDSAVPPWERARLPFVWSGETLVAIPGLGVAADFAAQPGEAGVVLRWVLGR